jgi:superfamily II DNA helicase RecQ
MARRRPSNLIRLLDVKGVGEKKSRQYGEAILETIRKYCQANSLDMDID